jgi:hypothetical protein
VRRRITALLATSVALGVGAPTTTGSGTAEESTTAAPKPRVVKTVVKTPKRQRIFVHRFRPWAQPTVPQVHRIIAHEAARWGAPQGRLSCRIRGESGYRWYANNGQYDGLGQFADSTFSRGLSTMPRRIRWVEEKSLIRRRRVVRLYDNGSRRVTRGRRVRQRILHIYKGKIPKWPTKTHGWAQVRIMAQALVGRSAVRDSEWEVRC